MKHPRRIRVDSSRIANVVDRVEQGETGAGNVNLRDRAIAIAKETMWGTVYVVIVASNCPVNINFIAICAEKSGIACAVEAKRPIYPEWTKDRWSG